MAKIVILYHANYMDGMGARYAAWKKFGDKAEYYPCQYGQPLPSFEQGPETEVYMLDYSTSRTDLEALRRACKRVVIVDHHQTAEAALKGLDDVVFDMTKSGAVLAWEYFHPGIPIPVVLTLVQDQDLWRFQYRDTKEVHAGLGFLKGNMEEWDKLNVPHMCHANMGRTIIGGPLTKVIEQGRLILEREQETVKAAIPKNVRVVQFLGYKTGFVNDGQLVSEMGHAMCNDMGLDIGICWFTLPDNVVVMSMRSKQGTDVDVSALCKQFGGGGHKHAAGCRTDLTTIQLILEGKLYHPVSGEI